MRVAFGDNEAGFGRSSMFAGPAKRCPSPSPRRTPPSPPNRAKSAERQRPTAAFASPSRTPSRPSTPARDAMAGAQTSARTLGISRKPDGPWPAMKSLFGSFQGLPKKPVSSSPVNQSSRAASSVKEAKINSKISANGGGFLGSSPARRPSTPGAPRRGPQLAMDGGGSRRLCLNGIGKPVKDFSKSLDACERTGNGLIRACSLSRPASPQPFSPRRGQYSVPCSPRPSSPLPSRNNGARMASPASFVGRKLDLSGGKKSSSLVDDGFKLRMLHNRYLQWCFVNSRANAAMLVQRQTAERIMCCVMASISDLRESVVRKGIQEQRLRLEMKLSSILDHQITSLEDWIPLEREHSSSLTGATDALRVITLPLPIVDGAKVDVDGLRYALSSAIDILRSMCSPIRHLQSRLKGVNSVISELTNMATLEKITLDECWKLLASTAGLQVQECSLRAHLLQRRQGR
ncbi:uncharacterized protein LOC144704915 isoform X2 [Wolffia australiana]